MPKIMNNLLEIPRVKNHLANRTAPDGVKILLVDSHAMLRDGLRKLLQEIDGVSIVAETSDGGDALKAAESLCPDIVIVDIPMPDRHGLDITASLLRSLPNGKVIVLSSDSSLESAQKALAAGAAAYLIKENPPAELSRAIKAVLDQRIYLCPEVASFVVCDYLRILTLPATRHNNRKTINHREQQLLKFVAEGKRSKEIGIRMQLKPGSVQVARSRLMKKLGCANATELTLFALRMGIANP